MRVVELFVLQSCTARTFLWNARKNSLRCWLWVKLLTLTFKIPQKQEIKGTTHLSQFCSTSTNISNSLWALPINETIAGRNSRTDGGYLHFTIILSVWQPATSSSPSPPSLPVYIVHKVGYIFKRVGDMLIYRYKHCTFILAVFLLTKQSWATALDDQWQANNNRISHLYCAPESFAQLSSFMSWNESSTYFTQSYSYYTCKHRYTDDDCKSGNDLGKWYLQEMFELRSMLDWELLLILKGKHLHRSLWGQPGGRTAAAEGWRSGCPAGSPNSEALWWCGWSFWWFRDRPCRRSQ